MSKILRLIWENWMKPAIVIAVLAAGLHYWLGLPIAPQLACDSSAHKIRKQLAVLYLLKRMRHLAEAHERAKQGHR